MAIRRRARYPQGVSAAPTEPSDPPDPDDEPVPKIPYGRGLKLDKAMLMRIFATLALLVMIVVAARPCANATSKFVTDFDEKKGSASEAMPKPGNVDKLGPEYEMMGPNMTDEERKAAWERARTKSHDAAGNAVGSGSAGGSAGSGSAGSGSANSGSANSGSANNGSANSGSARSGSAGSGSASGSAASATH